MNIDKERHRKHRLEGYKDLASRLRYEDGNLYWEKTASWKKGIQAGREDKDGYRRIRLVGYGMFGCHKVIFFMHHGYVPDVIDHIDGNPRNNKVDNLRVATLSQNQMNCKISISNSTGIKGVYWHKNICRWTASIRVMKRLAHLGTFDNLFEAACARKSAELQYYGEFAR